MEDIKENKPSAKSAKKEEQIELVDSKTSFHTMDLSEIYKHFSSNVD